MRRLIDQLIAGLPDDKVFLTVDELNESSFRAARDYPGLAELFSFGHSRAGEEIWGLKVGSGSRNALVMGLPHPNEPIGTMTIEALCKALLERPELRDALDYTWYFVKTWDVDGTRLNEGWFKGPFTLYNYARNFFRPAGHQQVDWTFPIDYKTLHFHDPIPETRAMMELIDRIKPEFIYSLHNAGFGGVYWYMSRDIPEVYAQLRQAAERQAVPLHLGEAEAPFCTKFAPAVFKELGIRDAYDHLARFGVEDPAPLIETGTCSADYAKERHGSFTLLTELPYFFNKAIVDQRPSGCSRGELYIEMLRDKALQESFVLGSLKKTSSLMSPTNPFLAALKAFTGRHKEDEAEMRMAQEDPSYKREASKAEEFDMRWVSKFYQLLMLGLLIRANESELRGRGPEEAASLAAERDAAEQRLRERTALLDANFSTELVDIRRLVAIQLECGLIVADHLRRGA